MVGKSSLFNPSRELWQPEAMFGLQRPQTVLLCCCGRGKETSHFFELEMTRPLHVYYPRKVTHQCLLMRDKVWINTCTHTSLLPPVTTSKGHVVITRCHTDRRNLLFRHPTRQPSSSCAGRASLVRLSTPGVGHLLLNLCPMGDLGEKATFPPDPIPGEPDKQWRPSFDDNHPKRKLERINKSCVFASGCDKEAQSPLHCSLSDHLNQVEHHPSALH